MGEGYFDLWLKTRVAEERNKIFQIPRVARSRELVGHTTVLPYAKTNQAIQVIAQQRLREQSGQVAGEDVSGTTLPQTGITR